MPFNSATSGLPDISYFLLKVVGVNGASPHFGAIGVDRRDGTPQELSDFGAVVNAYAD